MVENNHNETKQNETLKPNDVKNVKKTKTQKWYPQSMVWLGISVFAIILDQWTKLWIVNHLAENTPRALTSFFSLRLLYNQGAAFSFLSQAGGWQVLALSLLAIIIICFILIWLVRTPPKHVFYCCGFSLVIGGAIGNLIDRIRLGYVIDFLYFHYHQYYWPAFNVADSCVCIGVVILMIALWKQK